MKTKTFEIEVTRTATVKVTLPETMAEEEFIKEWESGLWKLENREADIADYAARMCVEFPDGNHDGIGKMITSSWQLPDYRADPLQVVAIVENDDTDTEIIYEGDWVPVEARGEV